MRHEKVVHSRRAGWYVKARNKGPWAVIISKREKTSLVKKRRLKKIEIKGDRKAAVS